MRVHAGICMQAGSQTHTHACTHSTKTRKNEGRGGEVLMKSNTQSVIEKMSHKTCLNVLAFSPKRLSHMATVYRSEMQLLIAMCKEPYA